MENQKTKLFKVEVYKLVGDEYSVLGEYPLINGKILMRHNKCNHEWMVKPYNFIGKGRNNGTRCIECMKRYGRNKLTEEDVQSRIDDAHGIGEYTLVDGTYISANKKLTVIHDKCGYEWNAVLGNILKCNCPKCVGRDSIIRTKWNHDLYEKKISELSNGEYELVSEFESVNKLVDIKHISCGRVKTILGKSALKGRYICDICKLKDKVTNESRGERLVREYLKANNIHFTTQYKDAMCKYKRQLPFDFALLDDEENPWAMIEFDGEQHFNREFPSEFSDEYTAEYDLELQQLKDGIKDKFCDERGIIMLRIPYTSINIIDSILNRFFRVHKKSL